MLKRWLLLTAAVLLVPSSASAASNDMFRGKTITYIVATTAGGGYDTYGRMIARYMPKYLPGARVIVRNVPGAGNIIGANAIYTARPDGLTIGMFNTGLIYNQLIGAAGMNFDIGKFSFLGKAADPWGNERIFFEAEYTLNRKDYGLSWNAVLETGGFVVGDDVKITLSVQAVPVK